MPSIQTITDQDLIDAIEASSQRVVFVAPGIWPEVAEALSCAWHRMGAERVSVILDIDAEVCRFGYEMLKEEGFGATISKHFPGLKPLEEFTAAKESKDSSDQLFED